MGSRFFGGLVAALAISLQTLAFSGGVYEAPYTDISVLSKAERAFFDQEEAARHLSEALGTFAIVYPDERPPLIGAEAEKAFIAGQVSILSFSGLPNTFLGSMTVAKQIARANGAPVLGVHTGYGDSGVVQEGPKVFFTERTMNRLGVAKSDPAIASALRLLKARDLKAGEVTLVGYCLGALKAGNLTLNLEKERPQIFPKLRVISLGLAVYHSKLLPPAQKRQIMGNLDQFGRINSINEWDAAIVPGVSHTIRLDNPKHLPIPSIEEAFDAGFEWLPKATELTKMSDPEVVALHEKRLSDLLVVEGMQREVATISVDGLTDRLHDEKLAYKHAYLSAEIWKLSLERYKREGRETSDPKFIGWQRELAKHEEAMREHKGNYESLNLKRSNTSDLYEYQDWKKRGE